MCEHFRYISQHNRTHSVGRHYNSEDRTGLNNVILHVLQFGRRDPDSKESLTIRLDLEQLWVHRLRSTTPMGLNVFDWLVIGPWSVHIHPVAVWLVVNPSLFIFYYITTTHSVKLSSSLKVVRTLFSQMCVFSLHDPQFTLYLQGRPTLLIPTNFTFRHPISQYFLNL